MDESVAGELAGVTRWLTIHDDLLRGLTHALSNRVGTVAATAYLLDVQSAAPLAAAATLRDEGERLDALVQLLRLLPRRAATVAEPVIPTDVVAQAVALHAFHPTAGDTPVEVRLDGDVQPAYVEPGALVLAVAAAIGAAQRSVQRADDHGDGQAPVSGRVVVTISSSTETVHLAVCGQQADDAIGTVDAEAAHDVRAASWLLRMCGGSAVASDGGATIRVPTLQAVRRAQRG